MNDAMSENQYHVTADIVQIAISIRYESWQALKRLSQKAIERLLTMTSDNVVSAFILLPITIYHGGTPEGVGTFVYVERQTDSHIIELPKAPSSYQG